MCKRCIFPLYGDFANGRLTPYSCQLRECHIISLKHLISLEGNIHLLKIYTCRMSNIKNKRELAVLIVDSTICLCQRMILTLMTEFKLILHSLLLHGNIDILSL